MAAKRKRETYRAGIIGLGFIGAADQVSGDALGQRVENLDGTHVEAYERHPRIEIVCGSSRDEGRRSRFAARTNANVFSDWREMIETVDLDVVSIATYTPVHHEMTLACADRGIPVIYCEKPIAPTLAEADRMIEACERAGSLLVLNHNRRFNPNYRKLTDFVADGGLGELASVTARWGAGRLGNVGTHIFDAIRMVTRREAVGASGTLDMRGRPDCRGGEFHDPGGWGIIEFEGGLMATVDAGDYATYPMEISFNGTEAAAVVRSRNVTIQRYGSTEGASEHWPDKPADRSSMDAAVSEIVEWLDGARAFPYPGRESLGTFEAIVGFHASHRNNGSWVRLPLSGDRRRIVVSSG